MEYARSEQHRSHHRGTLNLVTGLTNSYQNTAYGTSGQYTYQVIRVPVYYNLKISATITAPRWNGVAGGVLVLYATDSIQLNFQTIDALRSWIPGAGGRSLSGAGTGSDSDYISVASQNANGGKGEGIAGTPDYLNDNNSFLDVSGTEGYPSGSYGRGAPGNAGGGATDGEILKGPMTRIPAAAAAEMPARVVMAMGLVFQRSYRRQARSDFCPGIPFPTSHGRWWRRGNQ